MSQNTNKKTVELLNKWLAKPDIIALIDAGNIKEAILKTLQLPAFDINAIRALLGLFLAEGYTLVDLIARPSVNIPLVETEDVQLENNGEYKALSVRYAADVMSDPELNLFLTLLHGIKYTDCKLHFWIYAPDDSRIYPEAFLYCDSLFVTRNYAIKDITDEISDYIITYPDNTYSEDESVTVYDIDGREDTAHDILEQQLNIHISEAWHEIFEKNNYRDLGIVL